MMRKGLAATALTACVAIAALGGAANGQTFPTRPITLIVPFPAGGSTDAVVRALATATERHLGQPLVIENRPGANGALGPVQMAATAPADGYTVALITRQIFRFAFMSKTTFDPAKDLTYIVGVSSYTFGVVVRSDAPWMTFEEFLADAKANPGKINFGTTGAGSSQHIVMEQIARQQGIVWTHVPFKGDADMLNVLLGGHIDAVAGSTSWGPLVNAGKFRLLVTFGAARTKNWPAAPVLKDIGIDVALTSPIGLVAPKGIEPQVINVLHDAFKKGLDEPSFLSTLDKLDMEPWYRSGEDFRKYALDDIVEQKRIVEQFGLRQD
jgi:tripartite-type tricarboxylate transporter receptor subunit TctC